VAEASPFFKKLKAVWKLDSFSAFVRTANSNPDFAALFPVILSGAEDGDAVAKQVLDEAGVELAQLAGVVVRRLFATNTAGLIVPVALAGGVFRHSQGVREVFCAEIQKLGLRVQVNPQVVDPVAGALRMARRHKKD
jgi:N-acetylglucosamine kinase-like BadF-type ATPase